MLKEILVAFMFVPFLSFGLDVPVDIFQKTINEKAVEEDLRERLTEIRNESREADLFIRKYFEKEELASDRFESGIVEKVEKAAAYVTSRLYEKGLKSPTDTETLKRALIFAGKGDGANGIDNNSEATLNSLASIRCDIENLLKLRTNYDTHVNGPEFKDFLNEFERVLKK